MVSAPLNLIPIEKSCYHGSKICGSQQTVVLQIWQWKMTNDLQVHDCIQEQNSSSCFSSIVQR